MFELIGLILSVMWTLTKAFVLFWLIILLSIMLFTAVARIVFSLLREGEDERTRFIQRRLRHIRSGLGRSGNKGKESQNVQEL